jgi:hypothetical protein
MTTQTFESEEDIRRIARGFLDLSLPKREWTHGAHFATALWLMRHRPEVDLALLMPGWIRAYNEATGGINSDAEGYHETITQASLRAGHAILASYPDAAPLHEIVNALMASPLGGSDWLFAYWSKARLMSVEARRNWVDPDLETFPF